MKRDMDLVRKILFAIEEHSLQEPIRNFTIEGYGDDMVNYHLGLMDEAGLIHVIDLSDMTTSMYFPTRLTWSGHEFLEAVRADTRWSDVKQEMTKAGGFVFDVAKALATSWMMKQAGLG